MNSNSLPYVTNANGATTPGTAFFQSLNQGVGNVLSVPKEIGLTIFDVGSGAAEIGYNIPAVLGFTSYTSFPTYGQALPSINAQYQNGSTYMKIATAMMAANLYSGLTLGIGPTVNGVYEYNKTGDPTAWQQGATLQLMYAIPASQTTGIMPTYLMPTSLSVPPPTVVLGTPPVVNAGILPLPNPWPSGWVRPTPAGGLTGGVVPPPYFRPPGYVTPIIPRPLFEPPITEWPFPPSDGPPGYPFPPSPN